MRKETPAAGALGAQSDTNHRQRTKAGTKEHAIYNALVHGSLNRFEAERLGDHSLNSTVASLRAKGFPIVSRAERVPTRFGRECRVLRYWIPIGEARS